MIAELLIGGLAAALAGWGFWVEPRRLVRREQTVALQGWPLALDGLRVAVASDLHVGSPHVPLARLPAIVAAINGADADLILLGGDYLVARVLGGRLVPAEAVVRGLAGLKASLGVYAVLGNHDRRRGRAPASVAAFAGGHLQLLENRVVRVERNGAGFWLAGLGDWKHGSPDVPGTLAQVTDDAPVIALTHNPDLFPHLPERIALTVCGHTHTGQVRLPLVGPLYTASRHGRRYAQGLIREGQKQLYVSAGIGTSWLPLRFGAPPEIAVLTITRR
jgi:uncharacterized protein